MMDSGKVANGMVSNVNFHFQLMASYIFYLESKLGLRHRFYQMTDQLSKLCSKNFYVNCIFKVFY